MPLVGIPLLRLGVCSESEVTFICTANESRMLHWEIDFFSGNDIDRVTYQLDDLVGRDQYANNSGTGVEYHFKLTSKSPLTSIMTTNTPTDLSRARVSCSNGFPSLPSMALQSKT